MPRWTKSDLQAYEMKVGRVAVTPGDVQFTPVIREIPELHKPIIDWCRNQVPAVPFINSRPDCASTIGEGVQDFTMFYRGKVLCIECKAKNGKQSEAQRDWAHIMGRQGFTVHVIRSFAEFLELVK